MKQIIVVFGSFFLYLANGAAADKVSVFVSIVPQKYFVQQIGKSLVDVQAMVQPGASPATYEPKPRQMARLSKTRIYFAIGVPFEKIWLDKIAAINPAMRVVHTDHGIDKLVMAAHHHDDENGEAPHEKAHHDPSGLDPHIWLSPSLVKIQARAMLTALQEIDPAHAKVYATNYQNFTARIDQLDAQLKQIFAGKKGLHFMVFHPSWGYFAQAYGLKQMPIELEGKAPKSAQLRALIQQARKIGVKAIFVQPQFSTKSAELVAREIGGQVVFADPLAENWMTNLQGVANKFQRALK